VCYTDIVKEDIAYIIDNVLDTDLKAFFNTNGKAATWEVLWEKEKGFGLNLPTKDEFKYGVSFEGLTHPDGLLTKLKQCFGVDLQAFGKSMTSVSMCPEQQTIVWKDTGLNIPAEFLKTVLETDSELCVDIMKFDTNMDKNPVARDSALGSVCFLGKCVQSSPKKFGFVNSDITFSDGPMCIPVRRSWLESSEVFLHAFEDTLWPGWNQYTTPLSLSLPQSCASLNDCSLELDLPAPDTTCTFDGKRCYAKLTVKFSVTDSNTRRLDPVVEGAGRFLEGKQSYTCTTYGASSEFSGVNIGPDGFDVVDPVHSQVIQPREPNCGEVSQMLVSGTSQEQMGAWLTLMVTFMAVSLY
jgi:hypothetical protein